MNTLADVNTDKKIERDITKTYMVSHVALELHTKTAINLVHGHWKPGRLGLFQFVKVITQLWRAVKEDDVYAEWYLMQIYEAIEKTREEFKQYEEELKSKMGTMRGFQLDLFSNPDPFKIPLKFSIPFGFMAAYLVENVDYLTRQTFTLNRLGVLINKNTTSSALSGKVQKIFSIPMKWHYTGVTRKDIEEKNQKAQKAEQMLRDKIPTKLFKALLNKEIKFRFLPNRNNSNGAEQNSLASNEINDAAAIHQ
jgi:integrating conjugative element protein (TIGR03761 family)